MNESTVLVLTSPTNQRVQVGVPAEQPSEALTLLVNHFGTRPQVRSAVFGLLRFLDASGPTDFTYTIGITCSTDKQREIEDELAAEVLRAANVSSGRWPIAFLPPRTRYFTSEAKRFYPPEEARNEKGLFRRLFGR